MSARSLMCLACCGVALTGAGCGSSGSSGSSRTAGGGRPELRVAAAASLTKAFTDYGKQFTAANARFSFAGSDQLAAQIQQGARPDVFASANTKLPEMLFAKGLVAKPVTFTSNLLVIAVPAGSSKVRSLADLTRPGVKIATGSASVPVGAYTLKLLMKLSPAQRKATIANVRSQEPDVRGVIAKVTQSAVDAGFVYVTDVAATRGAARAIDLPAALQPKVAYGAAVVKGSAHPAQAQAFVDGLLSGAGQRDLLKAGFLAPS